MLKTIGFILLVCTNIFAQELSEEIAKNRISNLLSLNKDKIASLKVTLNDLEKLPGFSESHIYKKFVKENYTNLIIYYVRYHKFIPLLVETKIQLSRGPIGREGSSNVSIVRVYNYEELQDSSLQKDYSDLLGLIYSDSPKRFSSNFSDSLSWTSRSSIMSGNSAFFNLQKVNSPFLYPVKNDLATFFLDMDFTKVDISFKGFFSSIKDFPLGFELSTDENILNHLPYQNLSYTAGARLLLPSPFGKNQLLSESADNSIIDFKLMYRSTYDTRKLYGKPIFDFESPVLNFADGFGIDLFWSKLLGNTFHFTYFSSTKENYNNPISTIPNFDGKKAYFSFTQSQLLLSFFKPLDENNHHRLDVSLGAVYYDVFQAFYSLSGSLASAEKYTYRIQPVIEFNYNLILDKKDVDKPSEEPILGLSTRFLEERLKLKFWLSILNWVPNNDTFELRIETIYLSSPFFRELRGWENKGGTFHQLRFRLKL